MAAAKKIKVRTHERTLVPRDAKQPPKKRLTLAELFSGSAKRPWKGA
jgi:hypothetical protein